MKTIKTLYHKYPITGTFIVIFSILGIMYSLRHNFSLNSLNSNLLIEAFGAIVVLAIIAWITGVDEIKFSTVGFRYTFKVTWFIIVYGLILAGIGFGVKIHQGAHIHHPIIITLECIIFALCIGLFEEGLYRGIFLSSLLSKFGGTRKGLVFSLIMGALLFGFIHVYSDLFGFITDPSTFSMEALNHMIGKTISTGVFGFVLSIAHIRTHNLWGISLVHGVNDLGGFLIFYLFDPNQSIEAIEGYVTTDSLGSFSIYGFIGETIIMIPLVIYCFRQIKEIQLPQYGMFKEKWSPISVVKRKTYY